jgi:hypothetical protein
VVAIAVWLPQQPSMWILSLGFRLKYKTMQIASPVTLIWVLGAK